MKFLYALVTLLLQLSSFIFAADSNAWKSRNIYFALTDRVAKNDNTGGSCSDLGNYCGGTFRGLESKLDYIQGMGFDAIWITPVVANSAGGYHGYWAQDLYAINSNLGTAAELKSLVAAAHSKGIYMMVDVVANHMGFASISDNRPEPLNQQSSYHADCEIDYSNQNSIENCRISGLPDLDSQSSTIRTLYQDWVKWLVSEYSFDGVRIDTVKHVDKEFWTGFSAAAGVYCIGEVYDGSPTYLAGYASTMPGLLNYAMYYPLNRFFQQQSSAQEVVDMHDQISSLFPDPTALGTFIDNHDNPRFLNQKNDVSLLKNALAYVILARGIPIVYYGTEQGYSGGADPANREDLWRNSYNTQADIYKTIASLSSARKSAGGLAGNDHVHLHVTNNAYAWSRAGGNLIVLTTNTGSGTSGNYCFDSKKANGQWSKALGSGTVSSDSTGNVCVDVTNGEPVVLVASTGTTTTNIPPSTTLVKSIVKANSCPKTVSVTFSHRVTTAYGESVKIVGSTTKLGSWAAAHGLALSAAKYTSSNPVWAGTFSFPASEAIQYKFVKISSSGRVTWESGPNRLYTVPACKADSTISSKWQ